METGPGRFAVPAQFELVKRFFDPDFNPAPGEYLSVSKSVLNNLYFNLGSISWSMRQVNYDDGQDNLTERAYIWNNMAFQIADDSDIKFVIEPDGTKRIENFRAYPRLDNPENFDFTTDGIAGIVANNFLEPRVDPSGIGRTVNINFDNIDGIEPIEVYAESDYHQDLKPITTHSEFFTEEEKQTKYFIDLVAAGVRILPEANEFVGELFEQGITRFIDNNDKPIFYGTTGNDTLRASDVSESSFPLQAINGANGIVLLGGQGNDTVSGDFRGGISTEDILFGHEGNDSLNGRGGDDILNGGADNDALDGGVGEDLAVFTDDFENYDYSISEDGETITFEHVRGTQQDGTDTLKNIEFAQFGGNSDPDISGPPRIIRLPLEDDKEVTESVEVTDTTANPNPNDLPTPPHVTLTAPVAMLDGDVNYTLNISPYKPDTKRNVTYIIDTSVSMTAFDMQTAQDAYINLTNSFVDAGIAENINFGVVSFGTDAQIITDSTGSRNLTADEAISAIQSLTPESHGNTNYTEALYQGFNFLASSPLRPSSPFNPDGTTSISYFFSDGQHSNFSGFTTRQDESKRLRKLSHVQAIGLYEPGEAGTVKETEIDFADSNDGVLIDNITDLSSELQKSGLAGSVESINILLDGEVVETVTPEQLTDTPLGLTYEGSVDELDVSLGAENLITAEVVFTPDSNLEDASVEHTVGVGEGEVIGEDGNPVDESGGSGSGGNGDGNGDGDSDSDADENPFERKRRGSAGADRITLGYADLGANGGEGGDRIIGNARSNILDGGAGNDTIFGHGGDDTITTGEGRDKVDGGEGTDTVVYADVTYLDNNQLTLTQAANTVNYNDTDTLTNIEYIQFADVKVNAQTLEVIPELSIGNDTILEGSTDKYSLQLNVPAPTDVVFDYSTIDSSALADSDYTPASGTITIPAGETTVELGIKALKDSLYDEAQESLELHLTGLTGAVFSDNTTESIVTVYIDNQEREAAKNLTGGAGHNDLHGGTGHDTLNGNDGNDTLRGKDGEDLLKGGRGQDKIYGMNEDDLLRGEGGNDTIDGGAGTDRLVEKANANYKLTDTKLTGLGTDTLRNLELARLEGGAGNNKIDAGLVTNMNVTLVGGSGNDSLYGGAKADVLYGQADSDRLEGRQGHDALYGGNGDDVLTGEGGNDTINGGAGVDRLVEKANTSFTLTDTQLTGLGTDVLSNIELVRLQGGGGNNKIDAGLVNNLNVTLVGGTGNDSLYGGAKADALYGQDGSDRLEGRKNHDALYGGNGDDVLTGEGGNDTINGGAGIDRLVEKANTSFTLTDTQLTGLGTDVLSNIELVRLQGGGGNNKIDAGLVNNLNVTLVGGTGNDSLYGGAKADALYGQDGSDRLEGRKNHDALYGGNGDDVLTGEGGNDTINGGAGIDRLVEKANTSFTLTDTQLTGLGTDVLSNIELVRLEGGGGNNKIDAGLVNNLNVTLVGASGNDSLYGGAKADALYGQDGSDTLKGEGGNDTINGGTGYDQLIENADVDFVLTNSRLTGVGTDTISNIESARLIAGAGNNTIDASGATTIQTIMVGDAGNDTLMGSQMSDKIYAGTGNDLLIGNAGDDTLIGNGGADVFALQSAAGTDKINDFQNGLDRFGLSASLGFSDLAITNNGAGTAALISDATNGNQLLAVVNNIDAAQLTAADFTSI